MDLVLKIENAEKLRYFQEKMGAKQLVIDVEKVIKDSEEFNNIFDDSCKKYVENDVKTLKEVTERMQSEFDATGKDVRYFMENKNIKPYFQVDYKDIGRPFQKKILKCPFCNTTYDDPFSTSKIYNGSWTKCNSCDHEVYIPKE